MSPAILHDNVHNSTNGMKNVRQDGFGTRAIHVGSEPSSETGAVIPSISLSTTYKQDAIGEHKVNNLTLFINSILAHKTRLGFRIFPLREPKQKCSRSDSRLCRGWRSVCSCICLWFFNNRHCPSSTRSRLTYCQRERCLWRYLPLYDQGGKAQPRSRHHVRRPRKRRR